MHFNNPEIVLRFNLSYTFDCIKMKLFQVNFKYLTFKESNYTEITTLNSALKHIFNLILRNVHCAIKKDSNKV